ncbi:MAG: cereblon family protein [Polyangiaceae bacterium]
MLGPKLKVRKEATELGDPGGAPVDEEERSPKRLVCGRCGHAITTPDARIDVLGRHAHTCINPAGVVFHIGCFQAAAGMTGRGPHVAEHSWFPGYAWQIGLCRGCGAHLGWAFHGAEGARFWGLILARLEERDA